VTHTSDPKCAKVYAMRTVPAQRLATALVALLSVGAIVLGVASAAGSAPSRAAAANPHLLLGVTGDTARFKGQTGRDSAGRQAFLGWGHGQTYGAPFAQLFKLTSPVPMIHMGTGGKNRNEAVTPQDIAQGRGDSYLIAFNHAISTWGKGIYVRPMAEMNN